MSPGVLHFMRSTQMAGCTERWRLRFGGELTRVVRACGHGDPQAWRRLLENVRQLTIEVGRGQYRLRPEEADDVAQVVQMRVFERLEQLRQPAAFPLWVRRLIHRSALDTLRQRRSEISLDGPAVEGRDFPDALDPYEGILLRMDVSRALAQLPERYREPVRLQVLDGMPQAEVGARLGRPRSTVATQVERGLGRLRRSLSGTAAA
jgi:RNA polymerase sigma-70 factor (ECF subfamily)